MRKVLVKLGSGTDLSLELGLVSYDLNVGYSGVVLFLRPTVGSIVPETPHPDTGRQFSIGFQEHGDVEGPAMFEGMVQLSPDEIITWLKNQWQVYQSDPSSVRGELHELFGYISEQGIIA
jgi:hypothetical protein